MKFAIDLQKLGLMQIWYRIWLELILPMVMASKIVSNFSGTINLMLLAGALIADSFAGRFRTILVGAIFYEIVSLSPSLSHTHINIFTYSCTLVQYDISRVLNISSIHTHTLILWMNNNNRNNTITKNINNFF